MPSLVARATREMYRRELVPVRARWWLAAAGMCDWFRIVARGLSSHLGERARPVMRDVSARMFTRRYEALREHFPSLPDPARDPRAPALLTAGLYRLWSMPKAAWVVDGLGGAPRGPRELARSVELVRTLAVDERWREVATHLGELLIVMTEDLPAHLPHARKVLGDVCFDMGRRFGEHAKRYFGLTGERDAAADVFEALRMSELVFHVNPEHAVVTDAAKGTGHLEGSACLWWQRPGWNGAHCGIFGQFQAGVADAYGLKYFLEKTIPKHGGTTCRVDVKPVALRRGKDAPAG